MKHSVNQQNQFCFLDATTYLFEFYKDSYNSFQTIHQLLVNCPFEHSSDFIGTSIIGLVESSIKRFVSLISYITGPIEITPQFPSFQTIIDHVSDSIHDALQKVPNNFSKQTTFSQEQLKTPNDKSFLNLFNNLFNDSNQSYQICSEILPFFDPTIQSQNFHSISEFLHFILEKLKEFFQTFSTIFSQIFQSQFNFSISSLSTIVSDLYSTFNEKINQLYSSIILKPSIKQIDKSLISQTNSKSFYDKQENVLELVSNQSNDLTIHEKL
jgi:hypothetical protein